MLLQVHLVRLRAFALERVVATASRPPLLRHLPYLLLLPRSADSLLRHSGTLHPGFRTLTRKRSQSRRRAAWDVSSCERRILERTSFDRSVLRLIVVTTGYSRHFVLLSPFSSAIPQCFLPRGDALFHKIRYLVTSAQTGGWRCTFGHFQRSAGWAVLSRSWRMGAIGVT